MSRMVFDEVLGLVIGETANKIAEFGFRRRGEILRTTQQGNSGLVEFQKSLKSSSEKIVFTINLAVVCGALLDPDQPSFDEARSIDAHLRQRIGMLMPGHPDKWWEITNSTTPCTLSIEVSEAVAAQGIPYLLRYLDPNELIALWESGKSPGLTEMQRLRYLEKLKRAR